MLRIRKMINTRNNRGAILATALTLVSLVAIGSLLMARSFLDHQRLNNRGRELSRAYYQAEAGVAQTLHWSNYPSDFTYAPTLFERDPSATNTDPFSAKFPQIASAISGGSNGGFTITEDMMRYMDVGDFYSENGDFIGIIEEIALLGKDNDPKLPDHDFRIRSVGFSSDGLRRTVVAHMKASLIINNPNIALPAALISLDSASGGGNGRVNWGEAWSQSDFEMFNKSQMDYVDSTDVAYDPYAIYRTEGVFDFPPNWQWGNNKDLFDPTADQPGSPPATGNYQDAFYQNVPAGTLEYPDFLSEYQTFKDMATAHGRYYSTDAAGNIYRDGVEPGDIGYDANVHLVGSFTDEFGVTDRDLMAYDNVFIDTIDGNPPDITGSNLSTINIAGTSEGMKGIYYINAHVRVSGVGNPPTLTTAVDADGNPAAGIEGIFLDGVLYTSGQIDMAGNAGVYGSVVTQGGFTGTGTMEIYYNSELATGIPVENGNVGSNLEVAFQTNY